MGDSIFDTTQTRNEFAVEYPEREARSRKRPAATLEPGDGQEELSPGLVEVLSKLNVGEQPTSSTMPTSNLQATPVYQEVDAASVMAYIDRGLPLPDGYGLDRLVALVRDPEWVFTYWEMNGGSLDQVKAERGNQFVDDCAWVLRIYRVDENMAADVEVDPAVGGWYVQVGRAGRYVFEMALLSPEGEWISLLVSSMLGAPYAGVSERIDEEWKLSPEAEQALNGALKDALELEGTSSRGGSRRVSSLGSSRLRSSMGAASSGNFMGASGALGGASGKIGEVGGSGVLQVGSSGGVAGSSWHFPGSSGKVPGSGGSGGFGWTVAPFGALEPLLERPQAMGGGPNWNTQPNLPATPQSKTHLPHFKVKLPRVIHNVAVPKQTWPPLISKIIAAVRKVLGKA